jgi:phosphopantothenoylcysteine synthetase/decarboxylase
MIQNGQLLAVFNSAHRVMKAENILKKLTLAILLIPAPRALSTDCGLAIRFADDLYDSVLQALSTENLLPTIIYRKESDSLYETIWSNDTSEDSAK